jgi:hypothetical protein
MKNLIFKVFDAGSFFMIIENEDREEGSPKYKVVINYEDGISCDKEDW